MRSHARHGRLGFTLVELMIVVAIIGVLAALAIFGVRRYLAAAKTSEAKNTLGGITRGAQGTYERETAASQLLPEGTLSGAPVHALCGSAISVPGNVPAGTKYQPITAGGSDFTTGDVHNGWQCLLFFASTQPIYYRYSYISGSGYISAGLPNAPTYGTNAFEAAAQGDLDGNSILSTFARGGTINPTTSQLIVATQIFVNNEYE